MSSSSKRVRSWAFALLVAGGAACFVPACGSSETSGFNDGTQDSGLGSDDDGGTGDGGGGGGGFGKNEGGATDAGGGGGSIVHDANVDGGQCGAETQKAAALPLDLFIMLDTSGSMDDQVAAGVSKYAAVKTALTNFVNDSNSFGIGVGIQFFPLLAANEPATCTLTSQCKGGASDTCFYSPKICQNVSDGLFSCTKNSDCGLVFIGGAFVDLGNCVTSGNCAKDPYICTNVGSPCGNDPNGFDLGTCNAWAAGTCTAGDSCVNGDYSKAAVNIAVLPGNSAPIVTALGVKSPAGGTPTISALAGAIQQAQAHAIAFPTHAVAVVLATDGLPDECDTAAAALPAAQQEAKYVADIQAVAAAGVSGTPGVKTFVIGVFTASDATTSKPNLDAIAMSGGTTSATIVTQGTNTTAQFQAALNAIKQSALPCSYAVPTPPADGGTPDYSKVNVDFTSSMGTQTLIGNRTNAALCDATGGWYFDVNPPGKPTTITLCPATCNAVKGAAVGGHVDVIIGCEVTVSDAGGGGSGIH